jgi:hypothetical protein
MIIILGKLRGLEVKNYLFPEGRKGGGGIYSIVGRKRVGEG